MPGIVGLITRRPRSQAEQELKKMVEALRHESTYVSRTFIDETLGLYLGWVTRKNAFDDTTPLQDKDRARCIVFSGEEYSEHRPAERNSCQESTDLSYLLTVAEADPNFPKALNGRFHGVLIDFAKSKVTLFNDRFGLHRVYYHHGSESFYFAAEAKAILCVCPELRTLDFQCLGELISLGCVVENKTLFRGISVLPPASAWVFQGATLNKRESYFSPQEWENQEPLNAEAYYQELRAKFSRILPLYFAKDGRIGMSLTGGLDTRMIMAWAQSPEGALPCYSFGGMFRECEDVRLARRVAQLCKQPFEVIPVGDEFLTRFSGYAERTIYLTDGCASVNRASDLFANERAAAIAPIRMTGNYGSEILRRIPAFKPVDPAAGLFHSDLDLHIANARETYRRLLNAHALSFIAFCQTPWHHYGLLALEQTQVTLRSPYLDNEIVQTAFRAPEASRAKTDVFENNVDCVRLIRDGNPELAKLRTDRGFAGESNELWAKLTRGLLEFTFRAEYAYDYGMPQRLAQFDSSFSALHFERLFLGRHKFNHYRVWYRDNLSEYVRQTLLDPRSLTRPHVNRSGVEAVVNSHLKGNRNYTTEIHQLLSLELIYRLLIDLN
jgi:asparagine synthase (glutamine-hydrolysing)